MNNTKKMKDSGIAWLGEIPQGWETKKLKFVMKYFIGATPESVKSKYYDENGFNWITITDLKDKFTGESKNKISELAVKEKNMRIAKSGSLLYSFKLSVGQVAFVTSDTYTNEAIACFPVQNNVNLDFWFYALESYFIFNANENIYGAKIFNQFIIDNSLVILPPLETQTRIADYLDKKTSQIDTAIKKIEQEIELVEEYKKSLIYHVTTGKIDISKNQTQPIQTKPSQTQSIQTQPSQTQLN